MATTSPLQGIPLPEASDPDNVPYDLAQAVDAIEKRLVMRFATAAARDAALPTPEDGMVAYMEDTDLYAVHRAGNWVRAIVQDASGNTSFDGDLTSVGAVVLDPGGTGTSRIRITGDGSYAYVQTDRDVIFTPPFASTQRHRIRTTDSAFGSWAPDLWLAGTLQSNAGRDGRYKVADAFCTGLGVFILGNNGQGGGGQASVSLPRNPGGLPSNAPNGRTIVGTYTVLNNGGGLVAQGNVVANLSASNNQGYLIGWAPGTTGLYLYEVHVNLSYNTAQ